MKNVRTVARMFLAVDPGKVTGIVLFDDKQKKVCHALQVPMDEVPGYLKALDVVPSVIIMESFRVYPWKANSLSWDSLPAPQVIGMFKVWAADKNVPIVEQPASIKKQVGNSVLRAFDGWCRTVGSPHARDAARHAIWYYMKEHPHEYARTLRERGVFGAAEGKGRKSAGGTL
jgi:hypothetical protein